MKLCLLARGLTTLCLSTGQTATRCFSMGRWATQTSPGESLPWTASRSPPHPAIRQTVNNTPTNVPVQRQTACTDRPPVLVRSRKSCPKTLLSSEAYAAVIVPMAKDCVNHCLSVRDDAFRTAAGSKHYTTQGVRHCFTANGVGHRSVCLAFATKSLEGSCPEPVPEYRPACHPAFSGIGQKGRKR